MKTYAKITSIWVAMTVVFVTVFLVAGAVIAQTGAPLKAALVFPPGEDKIYNLDDPADAISFDLLLANVSGSEVWTQEGFDNQRFQFYLFLYGPVGKDARLITTASSQIGGSPTPSVPPEKVAVEGLNLKMRDAGYPEGQPWAKKNHISELREYLNVTLPGEYKLWFSMSFVQYDDANLEAVDEDKDGNVDRYYVPFNDRIWSDVIEFKEESITLMTSTPAVTSDIRVTVTEYIFGEGSRPGVTKVSYVNPDFKLWLFSRAACEAERYTAINHKTCGAIANHPVLEPLPAKPVAGEPGEYLFEDVKQDGWVIIGYAGVGTDYKHLWALIDADDTRWGAEIAIKLMLMTDKRGKKSPGKSIKMTGSELLIIEPEYVEWTSNEELYPFAFESLGDWGVEVAVQPPEGFVADNDSLSETVSSELKAVQFTITDVGSKYQSTAVEYKLKHKKKATKLKSKIYIKLSRILANEKGVPVWGEDEDEDEQ